VHRYPFDPKLRRMSIAVGGELIVKGAPDAILPRSRDAAAAAGKVDEWASRGLRVLAVATRPLSAVAPGAPRAAAESNLDLLGLVGLEDPPRRQARAAIAACRQAGLRVAMITGDHPATARAVAREVGLGDGPALEGKDLPDDEAVLGALLDHDGLVVSRVSPEDKFRIARALQARGHVVAMTGDGVNDGPALQQADIGVAMGRSGTDVAREAADLVLLDDDFSTIVSAIEHGRSTFTNIRHFLTYHLTDNIAELAPFVVWALSAGRFPLALGVLQILSLDLVTDQLPALALGAEPPARDVLRRPPAGRHLVDRQLLVRALLVLGVAEALTALAAFGVSLARAGWHPGTPVAADTQLRAASGAAFTAVVLGQAANAFACRSETRPVWSLGGIRNRVLPLAVAIELVLLVASIEIPPLAKVLGQGPPSGAGLLVACLVVPVVLSVDGMHKWAREAAEGRRKPKACPVVQPLE
jgi:magnesium-transporting ATPase (P-type)